MSKPENSLPPSTPPNNPSQADIPEFLRIADWNETQGTVGHKLPFIKISPDLYSSHTFLKLPQSAKNTYYPLLQYAGTNRNEIPNDPTLLGGILHLDGPADLDTLLKHGFLEPWCEAKQKLMVEKYEHEKELARLRQIKFRDVENKNKKRKHNELKKIESHGGITDVSRRDNGVVPALSLLETRDLETKRQETKHKTLNTKPKGKEIVKINDLDMALAAQMSADIFEFFPTCCQQFNGYAAGLVIAKIRKGDKRRNPVKTQTIKEIWDFGIRDEFYGSQIVDPEKFYKHFHTLKERKDQAQKKRKNKKTGAQVLETWPKDEGRPDDKPMAPEVDDEYRFIFAGLNTNDGIISNDVFKKAQELLANKREQLNEKAIKVCEFVVEECKVAI
jgi:hypothetical protein